MFYETSYPVGTGDDAFLESGYYDADAYNIHLSFYYHWSIMDPHQGPGETSAAQTG